MADIIIKPADGTIKFVSGTTLLSTPIDGCFEYDGTHLCFTLGGVRKWLTFEMPPLTIGDTYQGGIVFYITAPVAGATSGTVGLISKTADMAGTGAWGCYSTAISGADGTAIGTGKQNTIDIVNAGCTNTATAAIYCSGLTSDGYSDWWLPSKDELNKLYLKKVVVGGFSNSS